MMSDQALTDQTPVVAELRILDLNPGPVAGSPQTEYLTDVLRVLKGQVAGEVLRVRVPGGWAADGTYLEVFGMPKFQVGERVLLFLEPRADGTFGIVQLLLGAFRVVTVNGAPLAVRDLAEARQVRPSLRPRQDRDNATDPARDFVRFTRWIADRAENTLRRPDYFAAQPEGEPGIRSLTEEFTLFESGGLNFRWFDFDDGGSVTWMAHASGVSGMSEDEFSLFQSALAAWNGDLGSIIKLAYGDTTSGSPGDAGSCDPGGCGFLKADGVNTILWDDPNEEISGSFSCGSGGVLGIGGITKTQSSQDFNGTSYWTIVEGDIVTQDGAGCFFDGHVGEDGEEVFGHELGHALGIDHSCGDADSGSCDGNPPGDGEALMRAMAHGDGRGADLRQDDLAAVAFLYPADPIFGDDLESSDLSRWSQVGQ